MAKGLTVLVIGYWSLTDNLTSATILPWLHLMQQDKNVENIVLITIERGEIKDNKVLESLPKLIHYPLLSSGNRFNLFSKINEFVVFPGQISAIARSHSVDFILAHGALAGTLAFKVYQKIKLPFYVSSFEPHAEYMTESGVWNYYSLKYQMQQHWEKKQKKYAAGLITVSEQFRKHLLQYSKLNPKVKTVRSPVNVASFGFDVVIRSNLRSELKWQTATIGIYAGKYGDLYYDDEAFQIYSTCFKLMPEFRLIILSPQPREEILQHLQKHKIDLAKVHVASVPHNEVPQYLSAADFAFATIKAFPAAKYCSPVKIGEYWANGLPVLLTEGVGDDSDIIKNEGGGALFNLEQPDSVEKAVQRILTIVQDPMHRQEIPKLAAKYRSMEQVREVYEYFFNRLPER